MDMFYELPFLFLNPPNLRVKKPSWVQQPSAMTMFTMVMISYFMVCGGLIYDVIVEPPSIGTTVDEHGHSKPVAFMPYRVNGQYIMEGLAASFFFSFGALGFILLDKSSDPHVPKLNRTLMTWSGFFCVIVSFFLTWIFMRMKLPGYLN